MKQQLNKNAFKKRFGKTLLSKILLLVMCMFVLSIVLFVLSRFSPGDPLVSFYGDKLYSMAPEEVAAARARLGLDQNIIVQYFKWLGGVFTGDFGLSLKYKKPVLDVVMPLLPNTLILGILAYTVVFALAIVLAVICAANEDNWIDRIICKIGTTLYYTPTFWFGIILVLVFSITLKWFPSSGAYDIGQSGNILNRMWHLILPLIVMVASHLWYYAYMIRNKLLDELRKDYVLLAKSKGLGKYEIIWKHCLRNVAPTIVSIMAISTTHIMTGGIIIESIFDYPGIGNLAIESAKLHDYNLLMLTVLITGMLVFITSLIGQTVNERIDPRMKVAGMYKW